MKKIKQPRRYILHDGETITASFWAAQWDDVKYVVWRFVRFCLICAGAAAFCLGVQFLMHGHITI